MKLAQINMIPYGSTGKIMFQIADVAVERGHEVKNFSTVPFDKKHKQVCVDRKDSVVFGSFEENKRHYYFGSVLGKNGYYSKRGTRQLVCALKEFAPDIVHIHNIHKFCLNLPILFQYLKKSGVKVVWTLHDCWSFTGKCPHFVLAKCNKWQSGCYRCPQLSGYPVSRLDNTKKAYLDKKKWFTSVEDLTLVTPSNWLASLVKESFFKNYPVEVIHNGIDMDVFKPAESTFRATNGLENKKIILGVSFGWGYKKGVDIFNQLAADLGDEYKIVLVGTDDNVDKTLNKNILSIHRTNDQKELAEIYSAADLFVNPTREEVLGLVNIEALACGTPVLTFKTGGCPEIVDKDCGCVVDCDDYEALVKEVRRIITEKPYTKEACLKRAKLFDKKDKFADYCNLYERILCK